MSCEQYTAGSVNVVDAPVNNVDVIYVQDVTVGGVLYEYLEIRATTGAGSGTQTDLRFLKSPSETPFATVPRPINGTATANTTVLKDGSTTMFCVN